MQKTIKMERFIIKKLLKQRGMNLQQLADILQINRVNLYSSLNGNPTLGKLEEIAKILEVDVIDLFAKSPNKKNELNGFIEYHEQIHKISCVDDLEELLKKVKNE